MPSLEFGWAQVKRFLEGDQRAERNERPWILIFGISKTESLLDIKIIYLTVFNVFRRGKGVLGVRSESNSEK
jgi:hypothetical protein